MMSSKEGQNKDTFYKGFELSFFTLGDDGLFVGDFIDQLIHICSKYYFGEY